MSHAHLCLLCLLLIQFGVAGIESAMAEEPSSSGKAALSVPFVPDEWTVSCSVQRDLGAYRKFSARVAHDGAAIARFSYGGTPVRQGTLGHADRQRAVENATYAINYYRLLPVEFADGSREMLSLAAGTGRISITRLARNPEGTDAHALFKLVRGGLTETARRDVFVPERREEKTRAVRYSARPLVPESLPNWRVRIETEGDFDGLPSYVTLSHFGHLFIEKAGERRDDPPRASATIAEENRAHIPMLATRALEQFAFAPPRAGGRDVKAPRRRVALSLTTASADDDYGITIEETDLDNNDSFRRDVDALIESLKTHLPKGPGP